MLAVCGVERVARCMRVAAWHRLTSSMRLLALNPCAIATDLYAIIPTHIVYALALCKELYAGARSKGTRIELFARARSKGMRHRLTTSIRHASLHSRIWCREL